MRLLRSCQTATIYNDTQCKNVYMKITSIRNQTSSLL